MTANDDRVKKLPNAARRRERDFISFFNALWYRDFPFTRDREPKTVCAMHTAHINSVIKGCADLMGFFTWFEHSNRTDLVIVKANHEKWAKVELEWRRPNFRQINEIEKLSRAAEEHEASVYVFVGYSREDELAGDLKYIEEQWGHEDPYLILFLVNFLWEPPRRRFTTLQTYKISAGRARKLREQRALPWDVPDSRWQLLVDGSHAGRVGETKPGSFT